MLEKYGKNDARLIHEIVLGGPLLNLFRNLKPSPIGPETAGKNHAKQELSPELQQDLSWDSTSCGH